MSLHIHLRTWFKPGILLLLLIASVFVMPGCGITKSISRVSDQLDHTINSLDGAIAALTQESADWRAVIYDLEKELAADAQSTLRVEVQNLARTTILLAGSEARCNADFLLLRVERELIRIRNRLAIELNALLAKASFNDLMVPLIDEKPAEPVICSVVPAGVDLSLAPDRRKKIDIFGFDLQSAPISASLMTNGRLVKKPKYKPGTLLEVLRGRPQFGPRGLVTEAFSFTKPASRFSKDVTNSLSVISQYHAVLDLTESGVDLEANARDLVLSWNGQIKSEIPILARSQVAQCAVETVDLKPGKQSFTPPPVVSNVCGKPDKEFDGHGPCVVFKLRLEVSPDRKQLTARYFMNAWECPNDFAKYKLDCSEADGSGQFVLYTAKDNEKILGFDVDPAFDYKYIDDDTSPEEPSFGGAQPVERLLFNGDTEGDEVGTDTNVTMFFRGIKLQLEKCKL